MTEHTPSDLRRPEGVDPRPTTWWGSVLTNAVLATAYAAMYFSYVYIRVGTDQWPPAGIEPPDLGLVGLAALVLLVGIAPMRLATRHGTAARLAGLRLGLAGTLVAGGAHVLVLLADWQRAGFGVGDNAYTSLYFVLPGIHLSAVAVALVWAGTMLALTFAYELAPRHQAAQRALALYWYFVVVGGVLLLATVYGVPHVWPFAPGGGP